MSEIWFVEINAMGSAEAIATFKDSLPIQPKLDPISVLTRGTDERSGRDMPPSVDPPSHGYQLILKWETTFGAEIDREDVEDWLRGKSKWFPNPTIDLTTIPDLRQFVQLDFGNKHDNCEPTMAYQWIVEHGEIEMA